MYRSPSSVYSYGMYRSPSTQVVTSPSITQSLYRSPSMDAYEAFGGRGSDIQRSTSRPFISRSVTFSGSPLDRSPSKSIFGRTLYRSAQFSTPPLHSVAVQRSTPHYSDKYPYVRYSYGSTDTGLGIISKTASSSRQDYTQKYRSPKQYLDSTLSAYSTTRHLTPSYSGGSYTIPRAPTRSYTRYMPVDDAVDMYKRRCMTTQTLEKYWLSPSTWLSRRDKESNLSRSMASTGSYSYYSRYTPKSY